MQNLFLPGKSIYLRPLEREDAATILPWVNDPEVRYNLLLHRPMNLKAEQDFIDRLQQSEDSAAFGIAVRETDRLIGCCGLHKIDYRIRQAAFGIFLGVKEEWGRGYGTEATRLVVEYAFGTLNLNRLWLHVFEDNARGLNAYEKVGFRKEGLLRQDHYREGQYLNTIVMGLLREEWQARKQ